MLYTDRVCVCPPEVREEKCSLMGERDCGTHRSRLQHTAHVRSVHSCQPMNVNFRGWSPSSQKVMSTRGLHNFQLQGGGGLIQRIDGMKSAMTNGSKTAENSKVAATHSSTCGKCICILQGGGVVASINFSHS